MYKKQLYILLLIFLNIGADQYAKYIVREKVVPGSRTQIVGELLQLMNVENSGAFLGMGSESNPTIKLIFLLMVPTLVLGFVLYYLFTNKSLDRLTMTGLCCIVGGGIANLYDRFVYGSVTDFLFMDFSIAKWAKTGIFNIADLSVTTGLVMILLSIAIENARGKTLKQLTYEYLVYLISLLSGIFGLILGMTFGVLISGSIGKYTVTGVLAIGFFRVAYATTKKILKNQIK